MVFNISLPGLRLMNPFEPILHTFLYAYTSVYFCIYAYMYFLRVLHTHTYNGSHFKNISPYVVFLLVKRCWFVSTDNCLDMLHKMFTEFVSQSHDLDSELADLFLVFIWSSKIGSNKVLIFRVVWFVLIFCWNHNLM